MPTAGDSFRRRDWPKISQARIAGGLSVDSTDLLSGVKHGSGLGPQADRAMAAG